MKRETTQITAEQIAVQMDYCMKIHAMNAQMDHTPLAMVDTYGCQQNEADSERLRGYLSEMGYGFTDDEHKADLVLVNTCAIREHAEQRVLGNVGALTHTKRANPNQIICLCGCMAQEEHVAKKVRESYRQVDLLFGPHALWRFPELLWRFRATGKRVFEHTDEAGSIAEGIPVVRQGGVKAWVSIMYGCNNFCTYCIVPYVRGRERSRRPQVILEEIQGLVAEGYKDITLLGQNVNSYGKNLEEPMTFAQLLREVEKIDGIERIRFMTSHPKDLSDELIEVMSQSKKICRHLHLPLQSGSSRILKEMNRRYTKEQYLTLAEKIKAAVPGISLTTDIIVGFPGETEEDFLETMDVVRRVEFDSAFTFIYSKRTGTPAASMENQVPEDVVKERFDRLLNEVQSISSKICGRDVHTVQQVLVEEENDHTPGYMTGRLSNNTVVHFPGDPSMIGKLMDVYLEESKGFYYMARPV